ncbi:MAG: hypothetical protein ACRDDF_10985 [Aeromonas sp.]
MKLTIEFQLTLEPVDASLHGKPVWCHYGGPCVVLRSRFVS